MNILPIPGNLNHDPVRRRAILQKRVAHITEEIEILQDRKVLIEQEIE
jgi:hypothetical protein